MEISPVDEGDLDRSAAELRNCLESAKPATDNDDSVPRASAVQAYRSPRADG